MRRHAQAAAAYAAGRPCGRCNSHITVLHLIAARERGARACLSLHISPARALALLLCVLRTETAAGGRHLARLRSRPLPLWLSSRPLTRATWRHPRGHHPCCRREYWDKDIDIAEITAMPAERQPPAWRWRRVALLAAGGVLVSTALLRLRR